MEIAAIFILALVIGALLYERRSERHEWAEERSELLTRLQAPELVIHRRGTEDYEPPAPDPLPAGPFTDVEELDNGAG